MDLDGKRVLVRDGERDVLRDLLAPYVEAELKWIQT